MNLIDSTVKKVLSEPVEKYGKWWVKVLAQDDYVDTPSETQIMCFTKDEALAVKEGHVFQT